jgi:hypothetical protein
VLDQWRTLHPANGVRETRKPASGFTSPSMWLEAAK